MPLGKRIRASTSQQDLPQGQHLEEGAGTHATPIAPSSQKTALESLPFQVIQPQYSFEDIILNPATHDAIQDVLTLYEKYDLLFNQWGLGIAHKRQQKSGINLYGPPGTGKSMAAHAIANQLGRKILAVDYSQIESKYVGETAKNLVAMFDYAKKEEAIIFFDEADALLSRRVTNMTNSTDVSVNQTRSVLLLLLNDYEDLVLFASNFITNYDPAFLRRITAHVKFELPDEEGRSRLWEMYIPARMPTNVKVPILSAKYAGISGSDISNAVFNAALRAARLDEDTVQHSYFEEAIERIITSKTDNEGIGIQTSRRTVSEEYVKKQFEGELPK